MPTLRQRRDGGYYIRGYIPASGGLCTWQVTAEGLSVLARSGVGVGDNVAWPLLRHLRDHGFAYTGGSGLGGGIAGSGPRSGGRPLSLILERSNETAWRLVLVLPAVPGPFLTDFPSGNEALDVLQQCAFRINREELLQGWRLWPGRGDATCVVAPQAATYAVDAAGPWPTSWDLTAWTRGAEGLKPSGTLFAAPELGGSRITSNEAIATDASYVLVVNHPSTPHEVWRIPNTLSPRQLESYGDWDALELHVPTPVPDDVQQWFLSLGYPIGDPAWHLQVISPVPRGYSASGMPLFEVGGNVVLAAYPPARDRQDHVQLIAERDGSTVGWVDLAPPSAGQGVGQVASLDGDNDASSDRNDASSDREAPVYLLWRLASEGVHRLRAAAGAAVPIMLSALPEDDLPEPPDLRYWPSPLELEVTGGSTGVLLRAYLDGQGPHEVTLELEEGGQPPSIAVRCPAPLRVSWSFGTTRGRWHGLAAQQLDDLLSADLNSWHGQRDPFVLQIDADSFGALTARIVGVSPTEPANLRSGRASFALSSQADRRARWLAIAVPAVLDKQRGLIDHNSQPSRLRRNGLVPLALRPHLASLARMVETPAVGRVPSHSQAEPSADRVDHAGGD